MYKKKISFGVLFGGIGLIVSTLSGLIIYPLLLKSSSKEIAGLWFFYISFSIIIALGEGGLAPIVMRRAAKAKVDNDPEQLNHFLDFYLRQNSPQLAECQFYLADYLLYLVFDYFPYIFIFQYQVVMLSKQNNESSLYFSQL